MLFSSLKSSHTITSDGQSGANTTDRDTRQSTNELLALVKKSAFDNKGSLHFSNQRRLLDLLQSFRGYLDKALEPNPGCAVSELHDDLLRWHFLGKVASQIYGHILQALLDQVLANNKDFWYWTEIINSDRSVALYSLQTSPFRLWHWSMSIRGEIQHRGISISNGWKKFYESVRNVVRDRSVADIHDRVTVPLTLSRAEIRRKISGLQQAKNTFASALGYLLSNTFCYERTPIDDEACNVHIHGDPGPQCKIIIMKSVLIMDAVLKSTWTLQSGQDDFETVVNANKAEDLTAELHQVVSQAHVSRVAGSRPTQALIASHLADILSMQLPHFSEVSINLQKSSSKPSLLVRYWLPVTLFILSSATVFRTFLSYKATLLQSISELGSTTWDFWSNWILEPTKKVIGTIRHDEGSEVSIMSKRSLEGDRASLERMVVDFVVDNPPGRSTLSESAINEIRSRVQEGDLTSVLRVYEMELKNPLYGSVRGNLIRTLLIQVQKTKVDVEVAMRGIDNLLKSQELVFGFVGLTPGIIVIFGLTRWLGSWSVEKRMTQKSQVKTRAVEILRNIDRTFGDYPQADKTQLPYEKYGLLVCEATLLRELALENLPPRAFLEFLIDFNTLLDTSSGVGRQIRVADRLRWSYAEWL